jgi:hypothetical protein
MLKNMLLPIFMVLCMSACSPSISLDRTEPKCPCKDPHFDVVSAELSEQFKEIKYSARYENGSPVPDEQIEQTISIMTINHLKQLREMAGEQQVIARAKAIQIHYKNTGRCPENISANPISKVYGDPYDIGTEVKIFDYYTTYYYMFNMQYELIDSSVYPTPRWQQEFMDSWEKSKLIDAAYPK